MNKENKGECKLCVGRVFTPLIWGRKINDNVQGENKLEKIKATTVTIQDCEIRESLEVEDNRLELGC